MRTKLEIFAGIIFVLAVSTGPLFAQPPAQPQTEVEQIEVSDSELEKFAQAFQRIRMMNQQAQQEMGALVQDEDMEIGRFNQIHQASLDPEVEIETTQEEEEKYGRISTEIEEMQVKFQEQMEELITEQDLTIEKYQQIATQLQTDPELQERLRDYFQD